MDTNKFEYSQSDIEALFVHLYNGVINPRVLPEDLYLAVAKYVMGGAFEGFGGSLTTFSMGEVDYDMLLHLKDNVYLFSGAKTFNFVLEADGAMLNDAGKLRSFDEFKIIANEIFVKYHGGKVDGAFKPGWLEAEYNTAQAQANNAKKWAQIQKQKEVLPYLIYSTAGRACDICNPLNGICLPVTDPFWKKYMPTNHYNCLCIVMQATKEEGKDMEWSQTEVNKATTKAKVPDEFKFNPGDKKEIFSTEGKTKHPYFDIPKEYAKFAEKNFGLVIPK